MQDISIDNTNSHSMRPTVLRAVIGLRVSDFGSRALQDESGQILPWLALLLMFMFIGLAAFSLDIGHAISVQRQLQASADAAALAAAQQLPNTTFSSVGASYSDSGKNSYTGGITFGTPVVTGLCLTTVQNAPFYSSCTTADGTAIYNAVRVTETASFHTFFAGFLGSKTMTVTATSTAASQARRWNVAIILDTTPSMDYYDSRCKMTQLECAENGVSQLLAGLDPSTDTVALFTFPPIDASSTNADTACNQGAPQVAPYTFPATNATNYTNSTTTYTTGSGKNQTVEDVTYQVTGFVSNFQTANTALQIAVGNGKCAGMQTSMEYTFLAGAIYAAQAALLNEQSINKGSQNAMIILSDGNATAVENAPGGAWNPLSNTMLSTSAQVGGGSNYATSSGTYPSWVGQCGQEVDAAQYAATYPNDNTRVYTIAYGSPTTSVYSNNGSGNCGTDVGVGNHPYITPCQAMQQMTSNYVSTTNDPYFYSDDPGGQPATGCASTNGIAALADIFDAIRGSMLYSRLVPNNTN